MISAVGHEIDFTISDFVADLRAPTPSAAAEIVTGHWVQATHQIQDHSGRLQSLIARSLIQRKELLSHISARLVSPRDRLREQAQRVDEASLRLERAIQMRLERKKGVLEQFTGKLDALSPLRVLKRGYTLIRDSSVNGVIVKSAESVRSGQELQITFYDGKRLVRAI